jgi:hypothetical protein
MKEVGISPRDIFIDKQSGENSNREQYQLLKRMDVKEISFTSIH